jgi:hypothetical protein
MKNQHASSIPRLKLPALISLPPDYTALLNSGIPNPIYDKLLKLFIHFFFRLSQCF